MRLRLPPGVEVAFFFRLFFGVLVFFFRLFSPTLHFACRAWLVCISVREGEVVLLVVIIFIFRSTSVDGVCRWRWRRLSSSASVGWRPAPPRHRLAGVVDGNRSPQSIFVVLLQTSLFESVVVGLSLTF